MGADLIVQLVRVPTVDHETAIERTVIFHDRMRQQDRDWLLDAVWLPDDVELIEELKAAVDLLFHEYRRDVTTFNDSADVAWYVTGGMSHGDDPTDAFNSFYLLAMSGLDRALADEDYWQEINREEVG